MRLRRCFKASASWIAASSRPNGLKRHQIVQARYFRIRRHPSASIPPQEYRDAPLPSFTPVFVSFTADPARLPAPFVEAEADRLAKKMMAYQRRLRQSLEIMLGLKEGQDASMKDVIFVCVDCEAYEFDHSKVTEIGVAVLDTKSIRADACDLRSIDWSSKFQHAHYRPIEYAASVNRRHVWGNEDGFSFGKTTWISKDDAKQLLTRIFSNPTRLHEAAAFDIDLPRVERNVVLVGHGIRNDIAYLKHFDFVPQMEANVTTIADLSVLARVGKNDIALWKVLHLLEIEAVNLHNAGNDAAYTLIALLKLIVNDFFEPGSTRSKFSELKRLDRRTFRMSAVATYCYGGTATEAKLRDSLRASRQGSSPTRSGAEQSMVSTASTDVEPRHSSGDQPGIAIRQCANAGASHVHDV